MKMPPQLDPLLFAPCGMNCLVCYRHLSPKKPCIGCRHSDLGKPAHCRNCNIKACVQAKKLLFCDACDEYPCQRIKNLEKSYVKRYGVSLMENSKSVKGSGLPAFLAQQKADYTCPHCGGVISLHDRVCSDCQAKE